jgi:alkaline phosphatase
MTLKRKMIAVSITASLTASGLFGVPAANTPFNVLSAPAVHASESFKQEAPKNIIVMVGDGMGLGQLEVSRLMEYGKDGRLFMESLENVALLHTYSANNSVTDSGAAGTAIATGIKTNNESIGVDPDGKPVDSMLDLFKVNGKKVGLISTNTVYDATPAAFGSSVANRWTGSAGIVREYYENNYDVLLGGGSSYFSPDKQEGTDYIEKFQEKGYAFAADRDQLNNIGTPDKLLGLFHPSYMNYKLDIEENKSNEPSLNEMTSKALDVLNKGEDGFFLMVEGARIDHAAHAADITGVWKETIEFDNTVKDVVEWAKDRNDTLVVVLADHETMGISASEPMDIEGLKKIKVSPEYMAAQLGEALPTFEKVKQVFKEYAYIDLTDEEAEEFIVHIQEEGNVYPAYKVGWEIGSVIAKHYKAGVLDRAVRAESSTGGHTGNMVPVFATGVGSEAFEGVLDNTDIVKLIAAAAHKDFTPGEKAFKQFNDLNKDDFGFEEIQNLVAKNVINGYQDGTFRPGKGLSRGQAAALIARVKSLPLDEAAEGFKDVPADYDYSKEIAAVKKAGIMNGVSSDTFNPNGLISREQMATVLVKAFNLEADESVPVTLTDLDRVSPSHKENVEILFSNKITTGKADGSYNPGESVTRAMFAVFLNRSLNN